MKLNSSLISGTSGLVLPVPQKLYPEKFKGKSRINYYASIFNSLEVNSSFYKIPKESTVVNWAESVPAYFSFTFKLSKAITHAKDLEFSETDLTHFMRTIDAIGNKKGCLLIQFPPSLKIEKMVQLEKLLQGIKHISSQKWNVAVEFRNSSWYSQEVYELVNRFKTAIVIHDLSASGNTLVPSMSGFAYFRFHGPEGTYRGSYSNEFLIRYARKIKGLIDEGKKVYVYFNNTMGDAFGNLQTLQKLVEELLPERSV